jgi:hypothetical protein
MPKCGKPKSWWEAQLTKFARNDRNFSGAESPKLGGSWQKAQYDKIKKCPIFISKGR